MQKDFHVRYRRNSYSCPYQYYRKKVDLLVSSTTLTIYYKGARLTSHPLFPSFAKNKYSTHPEDMPPQFQNLSPWTEDRYRSWAKSIGPHTSTVIDMLFRSVKIPEQAYNSCHAVLALSKKYSPERLETACEIALSRGIPLPRYRILNTILSDSQDIVYREKEAAYKKEQGQKATGGFLRGAVITRMHLEITVRLSRFRAVQTVRTVRRQLPMAMLDAETDRKLRVLGVPEMVVAYQEQTKSMDRVNQPFENRLAELVDAACQAKYNEKVEHLLKAAHLRIPTADVTRILYDDKRPFSRELVDELATCHFVEQHTSLIIQGYPSSGKTYLSCAFAKEACKKHYKTAYIRMSDLLNADEEARMSGIREEKRLLRKYSQYQVLVIDEWLTTGVNEDEVRFLYELAERRFDSTSTIFATLHDKAEWLACLGEGALSESIIERFTHNVIVLNTGENDFRAVFEHRDPPSLGSFGTTAT